MIARAALLALCVGVVLAGSTLVDPPRRADPLSIRVVPSDAYLCVRVAKSPVSIAIGGEPETSAWVMRRPDSDSIAELPRLSACLALEELP